MRNALPANSLCSVESIFPVALPHVDVYSAAAYARHAPWGPRVQLGLCETPVVILFSLYDYATAKPSSSSTDSCDPVHLSGIACKAVCPH